MLRAGQQKSADAQTPADVFRCRMKEDKDAFMNSLLKQRKAQFDTKQRDFNKQIEE